MIKNKKGNLDEKDLKNIHIINSSGNDLLLLINDVLDLSRIEAGEISIINDNIDVYDMLKDIYDSFIFQTEQKGLEFELICDKDVNFINSDKLRIQQILKNLLSNALKFTTAGKISISAKYIDKHLEISVSDSGIGISEDKLEHIFDRFKQIDSSTTRKYGGTGLGLTISKELTALLGGEIKAQSKENVGSTFSFTILRNDDKVTRVSIAQNSINSADSEKVIVLNSDTISFLYISIELKKSYTYIQVNNLNELKSRYSKGIKVVIDSDKMDKEFISNLEEIVSSEDLVVIYEDESKKELFNSYFQTIKKPFKIEDLKI